MLFTIKVKVNHKFTNTPPPPKKKAYAKKVWIVKRKLYKKIEKHIIQKFSQCSLDKLILRYCSKTIICNIKFRLDCVNSKISWIPLHFLNKKNRKELNEDLTSLSKIRLCLFPWNCRKSTRQLIKFQN